MVTDMNGMRREPAGTPHGGRFARKSGCGSDDDLSVPFDDGVNTRKAGKKWRAVPFEALDGKTRAFVTAQVEEQRKTLRWLADGILGDGGPKDARRVQAIKDAIASDGGVLIPLPRSIDGDALNRAMWGLYCGDSDDGYVVCKLPENLCGDVDRYFNDECNAGVEYLDNTITIGRLDGNECDWHALDVFGK